MSANAALATPEGPRVIDPEDLPEHGPRALWPTPGQALLLRAALLPREAASRAWDEWKAVHDLVECRLDRGSFRLLPLVYRNLVAQGVEDPLLPRLKGIYRYWWCSNQHLLYRAAAVIRGLEEAGIRTLVLKGAATSTLFYRDAGARPMGDVDILVPLAQASGAVQHLGRHGWRPTKPRVSDLIRYQHSVSLVNDQGETLDLHWHVFRECIQGDANQGFWDRSVPLQILGTSTHALGPTDALLHTIVHGMRWNEEPTVRWIPDAMSILRASEDAIDWAGLGEEARGRRLVLRLVRGLEYLSRSLEAPIPAPALRRLLATRPSLIERIEFRLLSLGPGRGDRLRFGHFLLMGAQYLRLMSRHRLPSKLAELPDYLRYRLRNRTDPAVVVARRLVRGVRTLLGRRGPTRLVDRPPAPPWARGRSR